MEGPLEVEVVLSRNAPFSLRVAVTCGTLYRKRISPHLIYMTKDKDTLTGEAVQTSQKVRIVCTECAFSKLVTKEGNKSSKVIIEHGQETGHKLTAEELGDDK